MTKLPINPFGDLGGLRGRPDDEHYVDRAIDDPDGHPRALPRGGAGDSVVVEGRRDILNFETTIFDLRKGQKRTDGRFVSPPEALESLKTFGFNVLSLAKNHWFDLKTAGVQNVLEQIDPLEHGPRRCRKTIDEAVAPGFHLKTPKGTVALIAMASGLVPDGETTATASRAGVDELHVAFGDKRRATEDSRRILRSIGEARRKVSPPRTW